MSEIKETKITVTGEDGESREFATLKDAKDYIESCINTERLKRRCIKDIEKCLETNRKNAMIATMVITKGYDYSFKDVCSLCDAILYCLHNAVCTDAFNCDQLVKELMDNVIDGDIDLDIENLSLDTWMLAIDELVNKNQIYISILDGVFYISTSR